MTTASTDGINDLIGTFTDGTTKIYLKPPTTSTTSRPRPS